MIGYSEVKIDTKKYGRLIVTYFHDDGRYNIVCLVSSLKSRKSQQDNWEEGNALMDVDKLFNESSEDLTKINQTKYL